MKILLCGRPGSGKTSILGALARFINGESAGRFNKPSLRITERVSKAKKASAASPTPGTPKLGVRELMTYHTAEAPRPDVAHKTGKPLLFFAGSQPHTGEETIYSFSFDGKAQLDIVDIRGEVFASDSQFWKSTTVPGRFFGTNTLPAYMKEELADAAGAIVTVEAPWILDWPEFRADREADEALKIRLGASMLSSIISVGSGRFKDGVFSNADPFLVLFVMTKCERWFGDDVPEADRREAFTTAQSRLKVVFKEFWDLVAREKVRVAAALVPLQTHKGAYTFSRFDLQRLCDPAAESRPETKVSSSPAKPSKAKGKERPTIEEVGHEEPAVAEAKVGDVTASALRSAKASELSLEGDKRTTPHWLPITVCRRTTYGACVPQSDGLGSMNLLSALFSFAAKQKKAELAQVPPIDPQYVLEGREYFRL